MFVLEGCRQLDESRHPNQLIDDIELHIEAAGDHRGPACRINDKPGVDLDTTAILMARHYVPVIASRPGNGVECMALEHRAVSLADSLCEHSIKSGAIEMPSISAAGEKEISPENLVATPSRSGRVRGAMSIRYEALPQTEIREQRPQTGSNRLTDARTGIISALDNCDAQLAVAEQRESAGSPSRPAANHRHIHPHSLIER